MNEDKNKEEFVRRLEKTAKEIINIAKEKQVKNEEKNNKKNEIEERE